MNAMKQCLRCGNFCAEEANFCQSCQSSLLNLSAQESFQTDPMLCCETRVLPETISIQEGDKIDSGLLAVRLLPGIRRRTTLRRMRRIFIAFALLIIVVLIVDGILASLVFTHPSRIVRRGDSFPLLTLMPNITYLGQAVQLHLSHFPPLSQVLLTRDMRGSLRVDAPSSLIRVDKSGNAIIPMLIEGNWGVGAHLIAAEDTSTRYTASETLHVLGSGPTLPPQFQLSPSFLDMGRDWMETNTLRSLKLSNSGGGSISWSAKSNQSWLQLTPIQGVFSDTQIISVVATRIHMKAGAYQGMLTIASNTGATAFIQVKMVVRALPVSPGRILAVAPPVLAFSAIDGEREPADQFVTISNSGPFPLEWSLMHGSPTATVNQDIPFQNANWLSAFPATGVLAPQASTTIHIQVHSRVLFPGIYSSFFSVSGSKALDTPQMVAVSLSIQQHCGVMADTGMMSFIVTAAQQVADSQNMSLHATAGCPDAIPWSAFALTNWLAVAPANGLLQGLSEGMATISVAGRLQQPGIFTGLVVFLTEHYTQTIMVQLTVLPASSGGNFPEQSSLSNTPPGSVHATGNVGGTPVVAHSASQAGRDSPPLLGVSPAQLIFTVTQGQASSGPHYLTLANTGGRTLTWQASISGSATSWLVLASTQGSVSAKATTSLVVDTGATNLASGSYKAQIVVNALDGSGIATTGSPQLISVTLNIVPPCVLQVTPAMLSFSASVLNPNPADQIINLKETGNCSFPVSWQASSGGSSNWLVISPISGSGNGATNSVNVHVDTSGKLLGSYNGQITFSAQDSTGVPIKTDAQVSVTLSVLG